MPISTAASATRTARTTPGSPLGAAGSSGSRRWTTHAITMSTGTRTYTASHVHVTARVASGRSPSRWNRSRWTSGDDERQRGEHEHRRNGDAGVGPAGGPRRAHLERHRRPVGRAEEHRGHRRLDGPGELAVGAKREHEELHARQEHEHRRPRTAGGASRRGDGRGRRPRRSGRLAGRGRLLGVGHGSGAGNAGEVAVYLLDHASAVADRRGHPLDRAPTGVADREDPGQAGLERQRRPLRAGQRPPGRRRRP